MKKPTKSEEEDRMSDKPLGWPTHGRAKEARDNSAEEAARIVRLLTPMLELSNDTEVLRRVSKSIISAQNILRLMENQGAPTFPQ